MPLIKNVSVKLYFINVVEIQLLKKYKAYIYVFSEKKAVQIFNFIYIEYLILIKEDKNISFKFIYFFSVNELHILCNYFDLSLVKN